MIRSGISGEVQISAYHIMFEFLLKRRHESTALFSHELESSSACHPRRKIWAGSRVTIENGDKSLEWEELTEERNEGALREQQRFPCVPSRSFSMT